MKLNEVTATSAALSCRVYTGLDPAPFAAWLRANGWQVTVALGVEPGPRIAEEAEVAEALTTQYDTWRMTR